MVVVVLRVDAGHAAQGLAVRASIPVSVAVPVAIPVSVSVAVPVSIAISISISIAISVSVSGVASLRIASPGRVVLARRNDQQSHDA
jgi:hypothetical protein